MFSFKKFTVLQDRCAMKVCTDACLFGAWVAAAIENTAVQHILDIGTGTGLLSLMLAQKTSAEIDALEINADAATQAKENVAASPWRERVQVHCTDAASFVSQNKYQLIISNPPFYENDLRSPDENKNAAKHDSTLTLENLLKIISAHLAPGGSAAILLPYQRSAAFEKAAAQHSLFVQQKTIVQQTANHAPFRSMLLLSSNQIAFTPNNLLIHLPDRQYSPAFTQLLKDYYLKL